MLLPDGSLVYEEEHHNKTVTSQCDMLQALVGAYRTFFHSDLS